MNTPNSSSKSKRKDVISLQQKLSSCLISGPCYLLSLLFWACNDSTAETLYHHILMPFLSIKMPLILTCTIQFHNVNRKPKTSLCQLWQKQFWNNNFEQLFKFSDDNELTVHFVEGARRKAYSHITENALKIQLAQCKSDIFLITFYMKK